MAPLRFESIAIRNKCVFQDIFPGTLEEQAVALKDLLMNLPKEIFEQQEAETEE